MIAIKVKRKGVDAYVKFDFYFRPQEDGFTKNKERS